MLFIFGQRYEEKNETAKKLTNLYVVSFFFSTFARIIY